MYSTPGEYLNNLEKNPHDTHQVYLTMRLADRVNDNGEHKARFLRILTTLENLRSLSIFNNDFRLHVYKLITALESLTQLKTLVLCSIDLSAVVKKFSGILEKLKLLEHINISNTHLTEKEIAILAPSLSKLKLLQTIDISHNSFGSEGIKTLAPILAQLNYLWSINLDNNNLGDAGIIEFNNAVKSSCLNCLTHLYLINNNIGFTGIEALAKLLKKLKLLHTLYLNENNLALKEVEILANILPELPSFNFLYLMKIQCTDEDFKKIIEVLLQIIPYTNLQDIRFNYSRHDERLSNTLKKNNERIMVSPSMLTLVLASRRRRIANLPPELWELVFRDFLAFKECPGDSRISLN